MAMELSDRSNSVVGSRYAETPRIETPPPTTRDSKSAMIAVARLIDLFRTPRVDGRMRDKALDRALLSEFNTAPDDR